MKKFWKIFLGVIVVVLLIGLFVFLYQKTRPAKVVYEIVQPKLDTLKQTVIATGTVQPRDEIDIKPQIQGIISKIYKQAGDMVQQGDVIASVQVIPDMTQLLNAESAIQTAQLTLDEDQREYDRTKTLHDKGVVSDEEYQQSLTKLNTDKTNLQSAKDNLDIVKTGMTARYKDLSSTQIRSTITGMILDVPIKVGNSVIMANNFNEGTTIATVADMSDLLFDGNVDETDVGRLHNGMAVDLTIGALQNVALNAKLEYIAPKATADETGVINFEVKAAVTVPDSIFIRSGYSANANIVVASREGVMTLPENTIQFEGAKTYVYVLTSAEGASEQTFEKREVSIGLSDGMNIEVTKGVTADDKVRGNQMDKNELTISATAN